MNAANDELERSVAELLEQFTHDDLTPVARIYSCGFCEDGKTLMVMVDMVDGTDCFITLCPGEPISLQRTAAPKPAQRVPRLVCMPGGDSRK